MQELIKPTYTWGGLCAFKNNLEKPTMPATKIRIDSSGKISVWRKYPIDMTDPINPPIPIMWALICQYKVIKAVKNIHIPAPKINSLIAGQILKSYSK